MTWIDSNSQVNGGVTVGSCRINRLLLGTIWCCLHLLNRAFNILLIGFQLRATKPECKSALKASRYYVSSETQINVSCKWAAIHYSRWSGSSTLGWCLRVTDGATRRLIHRFVKQTLFWLSFIALWSLKVELSLTPQSCQFSNRSLFRSSPMVMNLG